MKTIALIAFTICLQAGFLFHLSAL